MSKQDAGGHRTGGMSLAAARLKQAREFILAHQDMSKSQIVAVTGLSDSTVARARRDLVAEGLISQSRNAPIAEPVAQVTQSADPTGSVVPPPAVSAPPAVGAPSKGMGLLDHAALLELTAMIDEAVESGDDEAIHKKLIKQCLMFALRPDLHPDTRMSASQMYGKLKDMARAKELGPGKPKTFEIGKARLTDLLIACGPEMVLASVHDAFTVKEEVKDAPEASVSEAPATIPETVEPPIAPSPPVETPRTTHNDTADPANPWASGG